MTDRDERRAFVRRACARAIAGAVLAPAIAFGQSPWTTALTATLNPLPIGGCGAVALRLVDPATGDVPRSPGGDRVSISDFDFAIAGVDPFGVAGQFTAPSVWVACACQGATVRSAATVTATYPAKALAPAKAVSGVAFSVSAPFVVGPAMGATEPPACQVLKSRLGSVGTPLSESTVERSTLPSGTVTTTSGTQSPTTSTAGGTALPLTVVVRAQWTLPDDGSYPALSPGVCSIINGKYNDPKILGSDVALISGSSFSNGEYLTYTATVNPGALTIKVCYNKNVMAQQTASGYLQLNGRRVNVLVLR